MKKNIFKSGAFIISAQLTLLAILAMTIYSCRRSEPESESGHTAPTSAAEITIANQSHHISFWEKNRITEDYIYASSEYGVKSSSGLLDVMHYFGVDTASLPAKDSLLAVVVYSNQKPIETVELVHVSGFLVYYCKEGIIHTAAFRKSNSGYKQLQSLSGVTPGILMEEIRWTSYVVNDPDKQTVAMLIPNKAISPEQKKVRNTFREQLSEVLQDE